MIGLLLFVLAVLVSPLKSKLQLEAENAVLRHQLNVSRRRLNDNRSRSLGWGSALHDPRPGSHLRYGRHTPTACHGHSDKPIAAASPWQNSFVERLIGSIRRECLDHLIVLGEAHLRRILKSYTDYHNGVRTHRSLNKDAPVSRPVRRSGFISSDTLLGGLHHRCVRV